MSKQTCSLWPIASVRNASQGWLSPLTSKTLISTAYTALEEQELPKETFFPWVSTVLDIGSSSMTDRWELIVEADPGRGNRGREDELAALVSRMRKASFSRSSWQTRSWAVSRDFCNWKTLRYRTSYSMATTPACFPEINDTSNTEAYKALNRSQYKAKKMLWLQSPGNKPTPKCNKDSISLRNYMAQITWCTPLAHIPAFVISTSRDSGWSAEISNRSVSGTNA